MDPETRALVEQVAEAAASRAVQETLLTLGVDAAKPLEAQRDFAALREIRTAFADAETQKDLVHLRRWRVTMEKVQTRGMMATFTMFLLGGGALVLVGIKTKFGIGS